MSLITTTKLRNHLSKYLSNAQKGHEILITLNGKVIARVVPPIDVKQEARRQLKQLRKRCKVRDVISPVW